MPRKRRITKEEWREITGHPGYQISNTGKVKSFVNNRHGIGNKSRILKPVINQQGYEMVQLGRGKHILVHRLVACEFIDNPYNLPLVRHMDDNPRNNNVSNLSWGTQKDNMQDCIRHGRLVGDTRAAIEAKKKPVIATPLMGGSSMRFKCMTDAARELDLWPQHISKVAKGELRQTGGWVFEYDEEEEVDYE